jgi:tRNA pseudouridine55 synthase
MTPGIHLVHKPAGPTSFSVVQECLSRTKPLPSGKKPKICHGGTLDPFAEGLLLILVEPATRLFDCLHDIPKTYEAVIRWGVETDNGDPLGKVVAKADSTGLTVEQLEEALAPFAGWHEQIPPATSAKRIDGERAYEKVQRGETVVMPPSRVYLHEARWIEHHLPGESRLRITVKGGFYVRAMARDLGRNLGCGAHLVELRRLAIGPYNDPGPGRSVALSGRDILPWLRTRILEDSDIGELRKTETIRLGHMLPPQWPIPAGFPLPAPHVRGFHGDRFCFLLIPEGGRLRMVSPLRGGL